MVLLPGARLGPYEIVAAIGAGGMGQVFRARDTRLGRDVAIKVLPELTRAERQVRERFEREAKVLASLDHPNICAIHDVGHSDGIDFLVMPYLEGETLASRIARGSMALDDTLAIVRQIADALDRAHRAGVVHRDLKPANVMLTKTGVRLLDFGLARRSTETPGGDQAEVETRELLTEPGAVMGTLPYMAPEQVAGLAADVRSDIWAFGCVLFEMLGGRRAFDASTRTELIGSITAGPAPSLAAVRRDLPSNLDAIVSGALVKDPEERWQSLHDVKRLLNLPPAAVEAQNGAATNGGWRRAIVVGAAAFVLGAGLVALLWRPAPPPEAPLTRFDFGAPGAGTIATFADTNPYFSVSPDGQRIAFVATVEGRTDIWIKDLDAEKPLRLTDTGGAISPFWSPDGRTVGFFAGRKLKKKALVEGPAETLCDITATSINGAWSPSGVILIAEWNTQRLLRVPDTGGMPVVLRHRDTAIGWPQFLPDGRHFLYTVVDSASSAVRVFAGSLDSGKEQDVEIIGVTARAQFASGYLLFFRQGSLLAQPFDANGFQLRGTPVEIARDVRAFAVTGFAAFSAAPTLIAYQAGPALARLVWVDRQGLALDVTGPPADYFSIRLSRDGQSIAAAVRDPRLGTNDLYIQERGINRRLTSDPGTENTAAWSPDGKIIVYAADRHGAPNLVMRNADGTGAERELVPPARGLPQGTPVFMPDGMSVLYTQPNPGTDVDIMMAPIDGHAKPVAIVQTRARESFPRVSPDGRFLAYVSNESGAQEVYVQLFSGGSGRQQVSRDGGTQPRWRQDSNELYFLGGPDRNQVMMSEIVSAASGIRPAVPRLLFVFHGPLVDYDVTGDGKKFLMAAGDPIAERGTLSAVVNWTTLLSR